MRILITNTGPWGTGSGTVSDAVLQELHRQGHEAIVFFPDTGFDKVDNDTYYGQPDRYRIVPFPATHNGIELYTFPLIIPDPNPRNYDTAWTYKEMTEIQLQAFLGYMEEELRKVIDDFQPDVIECQHIWALDHIINKLGHPFICVAHHSDQLGFKYDSRMQAIAKQSAKQSQYIFAISEYVKKEVEELYEVDSEKVIFIPNGYDQSTFYPKELEENSVLQYFEIENPKGLPIVTFCGKISKTKGIDILLKANQLAQEQREFLLLILGSGDIELIRCELGDGKCMRNVHVLGHRTSEELAMLHNVAKCSTLPSRTEGFGIAALEAMGCGIPLVATNVGGLGDFAVGKLVEPENPLALAEAIVDILNLPEEEYQQLCKQAHKEATAYSWEYNVKQRLLYYEKVYNN